MLTKRCEICGNSFSCYSDEKTCWCKEVSIDAEKSNIISNYNFNPNTKSNNNTKSNIISSLKLKPANSFLSLKNRLSK